MIVLVEEYTSTFDPWIKKLDETFKLHPRTIHNKLSHYQRIQILFYTFF